MFLNLFILISICSFSKHNSIKLWIQVTYLVLNLNKQADYLNIFHLMIVEQ